MRWDLISLGYPLHQRRRIIKGSGREGTSRRRWSWRCSHSPRGMRTPPGAWAPLHNPSYLLPTGTDSSSATGEKILVGWVSKKKLTWRKRLPRRDDSRKLAPILGGVAQRGLGGTQGFRKILVRLQDGFGEGRRPEGGRQWPACFVVANNKTFAKIWTEKNEENDCGGNGNYKCVLCKYKKFTPPK